MLCLIVFAVRAGAAAWYTIEHESRATAIAADDNATRV
jgi:hypothetical protein